MIDMLKKYFCLRFFFLIFLFLVSCSGEGIGKDRAYKIGIDPFWYPVDFGQQEIDVNGFVDELLLEIARETGMVFEKEMANWDSLYKGLDSKKFDGIIGFLRPYAFNEDKYLFSKVFLVTGPALVTAKNSPYSSLDEMSGKLIFVLKGSDMVNLLQKYPEVLINTYDVAVDALNHVSDGLADGALVRSPLAKSYVDNIYYDKLKVGKPLDNEEGIRFIAKISSKKCFDSFSQGVKILEKSGKLKELRRKWHLSER